MKKKTAGYLILGICVLAVLCAPGYRDVVTTVIDMSEKPIIVLDPGHGGIDGGAESSDGTSEKDINLDIALLVKKKLQARDMRIVLTRKEDKGLYSNSEDKAIRSLKTEDMKARKQILDEVKPDLTVSIHLNSFTQDSSVKGAQVFYPTDGEAEYTEASKMAAKIMQECLNRDLNGEDARSELGKNDVFLFRDITSPIVIAECGFLSNREEADKLKNKKYQKKIAGSIVAGICGYLDENGKNR